MDISEIKNRNDLALFLGISRKALTNLLYIKEINNCYHSFSIPKKSGGERIICAPNDDLKNLQKKLATILYKIQEKVWRIENTNPNISHGFTKKKSIVTNASIHTKKKYILNIDLNNFFDSFHFGRVCGYFEKNKYFKLPHEVAIILAQLTCYKGVLPQGAPTSPIITNLICQILDYRLLNIAKAFRLDYTRYADDLTFSTNDKHFIENYDNFYAKINIEINKSGFSINEKKTRLQYKYSRQTVTGLVVNEKPNINREYYKTTKAMAYSLYKNNSFTINNKKGTINQLNGRFAYINQIEKNQNKRMYKSTTNKKYEHNFRCLSSREEEYRKFLFYKNFIATNKPIIITEGKTDILYIKAALKNLYLSYPNLISKKDNGNFDFKISFFSRSKVICYLYGISRDGADAMKNLYNYFSEKTNNNSPDYKTYFSSKFAQEISKPIIFLFDNELNAKDKPLKKFTDYVGIKQKECLKNNLFTSIDNKNLFIVTNPIIGEKKECEIEDLFELDTLNHKINNKSFSRESNYDINNYYGKNEFSKYVIANYKNIDFSNFKRMLDVLNEISPPN
ncbi:MAG: retron Ec67 family RNA-directed DNA polymerase/endonuclease [Ruminococcus sp.]|nr:retron Ec67 family RNA-directed DNA polymerase/endonuclease [Ruminococcus sp.]